MEFRTADGSNNSLTQSDLNASGSAFVRIGPARYTDGVHEMVDGPNPRMISNVVVGEGEAATPNGQGLSGMMYAWGQFIDHDITRTPSDRVTRIDIAVPQGDADFPDGTKILLSRAVTHPTSGTGPENPATPLNAVTGWLDASMVYGSDTATAASLRLANGRMKTSDGDNLPIVGGQFLAGDVRAAENPALTALHTLFVREHNWQVERLHAAKPCLTGDELYEQARAIVAAEIAHITYEEFLPHLVGPDAIADYAGYNPAVDPRLSVEFAGAAYRWGHSTVSAETERKDERGEVAGADLELRDVFFMPPAAFITDSGADGFLRHLGADLAQAMDARIVDDLRNFLVDADVGQDLAAINIQRGRDVGIGTLNQTRTALGLTPYDEFEDITQDSATVDALRKAFVTVDKIDLWTGGLSESLAPGAFLGETFRAIVADQFEALRDGDRLWFQAQGFDARTLSEIERTTLSDIILRNTDTKNIQDDIFTFVERRGSDVASEHSDLPQLVVGSNGRDELIGGMQDDILVAGRGRQTLRGGEGNDRFVLDGPTKATVADFQPGHDHLQLNVSKGKSFADLDIRGDADGTVLRLGYYRIELSGIRPDELGPGDFIFV
ncbi:hypothetical protein JMJ56_28345 [Belnapia sp. T18]|uniref:Peroxidase n=1 Tax=Belnapia arida TaxID=2804533 RepID=A0ABS1UB69_9PROT|nr:peroxidase family protein [Belnapia arida]MBL6081899.1 hypothetical protein [Belnapia arida]